MSEHPGVTQRPPAYAELLVDSQDRYKFGFPSSYQEISTSSDWKTNFQQIVLNGYFTRLAVTQVHFQWNLPTIIQGYNDAFRMTIGGGIGNVLVQLDEGYYTPDSLATELAAQINAVAPAINFTVTFTQLNGAFFITNTTATPFLMTPPAQNDIVFRRTLQTLGFLFTGGPVNRTTYPGCPPSMLATRFIDICSSTLTKYQRVKDSTTLQSPTISNVIARVYPTAPNTRVPTLADAPATDSTSIGSHPFYLCIDYNTPKHIKWDPNEPLSNFDLQLRDDFGELVPFDTPVNPLISPVQGRNQYGCEYQLTIYASES